MNALVENNLFKYVPIATAASIATLGLFICMYLLIAMDVAEPTAKKPKTQIDIFMPKHTPKIIPTDKKVEPVNPPDPTPPTPELNIDPIQGSKMLAKITSPTLNHKVTIDPRNNTGVLESGVIPQVRVGPVYPERARARGIEGYVDLNFTVLKTGKVSNVQVIDSTPLGVFDRAAIKALKKWRYKPQLANGEPVITHNVQTRMRFKLDQ